MVSLFVHRRVSGIFLGGVLGTALGLLAGPVCLLPRSGFTHLLVISLAGGIALLGIGATARLTDRRRRVSLRDPDDVEFDLATPLDAEVIEAEVGDG